jgi:hypothetical protein
MSGVARLLCLAGLLAAGLTNPAAHAAPQLQPDLTGLDTVPHYSVAGAQAAHALQARKPPARSSEPPHFAAAAGVALGLADGRWQRLDDGSWSWRARVGSAGAKLLNFRFGQFRLPPSGRLYVYDTAGQVVQGPYTSASQTPEGMLWTAVVPGAEAVLELRVSDAERGQVRLALDTVYHGYATLDEVMARSDLANTPSASCEINVACPAGANWSNEIRSAAVFTAQDSVIGEFICSGDLVNNQRGDGTPYFLTAHHCRVGWSGTSPASSMVVYWNYQASSCDGSSGSLADNQTGAIFDATDATSDFDLLTLSSAPAASWNVRFAGLDASGAVPTSGVGIHQPEGDIKKISTYTAPASSTAATLCTQTVPGTNACLTSQSIQAWAVNWAQGITEEGSSGSGLWDENHRIVGVLSGGSSACGTSGPDVYGRLDQAWIAAGTGGSLAKWLDPDNTGTRIIDARDANGATGTGGSGATISAGGGGGSAAPLLLLAPLALLRRRRARR